jgi:hypothetical protein
LHALESSAFRGALFRQFMGRGSILAENQCPQLPRSLNCRNLLSKVCATRQLAAQTRANGREVAEYRWSGYVLATLLPYLQEKHQINLMKAEYDDIANLLTNATAATHFIFTPSQSLAFLKRLDPALFSQDEMRDYFNAFNETQEQEIGRAMLDGIAALRESLRQLDESSVIVFGIL